MSKVVKGYELIKMLSEGEIKEGTKIKDNYKAYVYEESGITSDLILFILNENGSKTVPDYSFFAESDNNFVILEDEEEIDIQNIEENKNEIIFVKTDLFTIEKLNSYFEVINEQIMNDRKKQNELIKAVKQLDKKINKEES